MTGYTHVYTGNGKGKTTAALGLAVRAAGAGMRVFLGQFVKGMKYSEVATLKRLADVITVRQFGRSCFIERKPDPEDIRLAQAGLAETRHILASKDYQLVILDEVTIANHYGLVSTDELLELIDAKPEDVELVITGRYADKRLCDRADLVTEMVEIKHYYEKGVLARKGIDC